MVSNMEWARQLEEIYRNAPIRKTLSSDIWFDEELRAHFKINTIPDLFHPLADVHGGIIGALIDNAVWYTAAAQYPNRWIVTTEFHTYLLRPAKGSNLHSYGELIYKGKTQAVAKANVERDDGTLVAYGTGTLVVTNVEVDIEKVKELIGKIKK